MKTKARRFVLNRIEDETGVSGVGTVAEGVEFTDGTSVIRWLTATSSVGIYQSIKEVEILHGHEGKTKIEFLD